MRRVTEHRSAGPHNSLWYWTKAVPVWRVARNYVLMRLARGSPSLRAKNWMYRRMGVAVGRSASVGLEVTLDIFFPELIELGDDCIVGYGTTILCHEFLHGVWRTGPVRVGHRATIGANCTLLAGIEVADDAVVSAHSLVNRDVDGFVGGVPARPLEGSGAGLAEPPERINTEGR
ncbi:MAG: acetyltransferase [Halobacteriales archaeon]|nr:acetyltransferase [Halobacteriales archaeon]